MSKKGLGDLISVLLLVVVGLAIVVILGVAIQKWTHSSLGPESAFNKVTVVLSRECSDRTDNDRDGLIDWNGIDEDGDGTLEFGADPKCINATDGSEVQGGYQNPRTIISPKKTNTSAPAQLDAAATCMDLRIEPIECLYVNESIVGGGLAWSIIRSSFGGNVYYVRAQRGSGAGDITRLRYVFEDAQGRTYFLDSDGNRIHRMSALPRELDYVDATFNSSMGVEFTPLRVSVAPLMAGRTGYCPSIGGVIECRAAQKGFAVPDVDNGAGAGVCDGGVDINDLLSFLTAYSANDLRADVFPSPIRDGRVDLNDLLSFLASFEKGGPSCCPGIGDRDPLCP